MLWRSDISEVTVDGKVRGIRELSLEVWERFGQRANAQRDEWREQ